MRSCYENQGKVMFQKEELVSKAADRLRKMRDGKCLLGLIT